MPTSTFNDIINRPKFSKDAIISMKNLDSLLPLSDEGIYPIRTVSEVSGVNSITLRAWERRHNLFQPKRTPKGHRLYSDKDIQRVHQVLCLLDKGVSIGSAAKALTENTTEANSSGLSPLESSDLPKKLTIEQWKEYQTIILLKIKSYCLRDLEYFHHTLLSKYPVDMVSKNLILPTLNTLYENAPNPQSLSGEYYIYKNFLSNRLGGFLLKLSVQNRGKKLFFAGLTKNHCEVTLLLEAVPFIEHGYQLIILGCDISLDALATALANSNAEGLILHSDIKLSSKPAFEKLTKNTNKPVFISGQYTKNEENVLQKSKLIVLPSKQEKQLSKIDKKLNKN